MPGMNLAITQKCLHELQKFYLKMLLKAYDFLKEIVCFLYAIFSIHAKGKRRIRYGMFCSTCCGSRCNNRRT